MPPATTWHQLPLSRRAAVLILLFADRRGDLRVVLTMRSSTLKSYAGQAALPGGKADALSETPLMVARREASEEIGLPEPVYPKSAVPRADSQTSGPDTASPAESILWDTKYTPETPGLPYPFEIEHLCQLPTNLAKTELGVRPCVAFLHATAPTDRKGNPVDAEATLIPRLDAKEVAAVFSGPFHNFLRCEDEVPVPTNYTKRRGGTKKQANTGEQDKWYVGTWVDWHETRFRMHNFYVPVAGQVVTRATSNSSDSSDEQHSSPKPDDGTVSYPDPQGRQAAPYPRPIAATHASPLPYRDHPARDTPDPLAELSRFRVFGMTARILVDCARVAYGEEPQFEHNSHFGDESVIGKLIEGGKLGVERKSGEEFVGGDVARLLQVARKHDRRGAGRL